MTDHRYTTEFENLTFEDFRSMATNPRLSKHQKVGFPDAMREGSEVEIMTEIVAKLPALETSGATVLDLGCGCSGLPKMLMDRAEENQQHLVLVDSEEMLSQLPDSPRSTKWPAYFPDDVRLLEEFEGRADAILVYSVIQYVVRDSSFIAFFDAMLGLLAPGGRALIGDIPNASMRSRFLDSASGREFHKEYMDTDADPTPEPPAPGDIDDALLIALLLRARSRGFHSFLLPQSDLLPMANRREDLLIVRP